MAMSDRMILSKFRSKEVDVPNDADRVIYICCKAIGLSENTVYACYKGGIRANFKNLVRWALYNHCEMTKAEIGLRLHHERTTVINGLKEFEDKLGVDDFISSAMVERFYRQVVKEENKRKS
jgi:nickel-dependent lactate racemase